MKQKWIPMALALGLLLTGCCRHEWSEPSCVEKATCRLCGETRGELLAHSWMVATWEKPMHCLVCGETRGEVPGVNRVVRESFELALQTASDKDREPSYAALELRDQLLPLIDSLDSGVPADTALEALVADPTPREELLPLLLELLDCTEISEQRRFSALVNKLCALESVEGRVDALSAELSAADTALVLQEMGIRPAVLGKLMTALSGEATGGLGTLEFTETGFTFAWTSDGDRIIDTAPVPPPVSEGDLVFYQTADSSVERYHDELKALRDKHGEAPGFNAYYDYVGYAYTGQIRTARGVAVRSPQTLVEAVYGRGTEVATETLLAAMFPGDTGDASTRESFLRQSKTAWEYSVTERVSLAFTFDEKHRVAWMIVLQR